MDLAPKTLESILAPGIFSSVVEFLDDTSINYLKQQNAFLNTRISEEQEANSYWKSRVVKKLDISVQCVIGMNWKLVYQNFKSSKSANQIIVEFFPKDIVLAYIEYQILNKSCVLEVFGVIIYKLILKFDRVDIYDEILKLLTNYIWIYDFWTFIYNALESSNSWNILVHLIPKILEELQECYVLDHAGILVNYTEGFKEDLFTTAVRYADVSRFMLIDAIILPTDPEFYGRILRLILGVGNFDILEYCCMKYPEEMGLELSKNLSANVIGGFPKYPMATYLLSHMSNIEYSKFLDDIPDYANISLGIWKALIQDFRTPPEFIQTQIKSYFYNTPNIRSGDLLRFAKLLRLDPSRLLPNINLNPKNRIGNGLLIYLLTTNRIPRKFREFFNEILVAMNIPIRLSNRPTQKFSSLETIKLGNYLISIFAGNRESRSYFRVKLLKCKYI